MKKKVKKAYNGIQRVTPNYSKVNAQQDQIATQQGAATQVASTAANSIVPGAGTALSMVDGLIGGATKNDKGLYRSKFAEFADTRLNPLGGLKVLASGNGKAIGNYLSFGMAGKSLNSQMKEEYANADRQAKNDTFNSGIMNEVPLQRKQFKKGTKSVSTKVIEIEGKKSPEIHTDSSFNIKNLGVTPHSQGGDKVLAETGDVIFPTQNSPKKYGKIMKAIREKDLPTLKKEQARLPKDSKTYAKGGVVTDGDKPKRKKGETETQYRDRVEKILDRTVLGDIDKAVDDFFGGDLSDKQAERRANYKPVSGPRKGMEFGRTRHLTKEQEKEQIIRKEKADTPNFDNPTDWKYKGKKSVNPMAMSREGGPVSKPKVLYIPAAPKRNDRPLTPAETSKGGSAPKAVKKAVGKSASTKAIPDDSIIRKSYENLKGSNLDDNISELEARDAYKQGVEKGEFDDVTPPESYMADNPAPKKIGFGANANKAMELAPIAYNLGQGLFGKTEKVQRNYVTPEMNTYTDLSDPLRRQSTQAYAAEKGNARNLSGGSVSNVRSNSQAAANREMDRQGNINAQEIARQDAIAQSNVGVRNAAKQTNLQLENQYNEMDTQNRAAKTGMLQAGLMGLAQIGSRNIQNAAAVDAQGRELKAISGVTNYEFEKDRLGATGNITFDGKNVVDPLQGSALPLQDEQIKQQKAKPRTKVQLLQDRLFRMRGRR